MLYAICKPRWTGSEWRHEPVAILEGNETPSNHLDEFRATTSKFDTYKFMDWLVNNKAYKYGRFMVLDLDMQQPPI